MTLEFTDQLPETQQAFATHRYPDSKHASSEANAGSSTDEVFRGPNSELFS